MSESRVFNDSSDFTPMPTPDRVVEGDEARRLDPVPFEFSDIRALAQRILKRAQEQAQQKLDAARSQIALMEKEAHDKAYAEALPKGREEGFAKGEQEGMKAAEGKIEAAIESERESLRQNAQPVLEILQQLAQIMNDNRQQLLAQAEGDLLLLALDIAKRLVGHELSVDPEAIRPLATECIGLVTDRSAVAVRVNPEDHRVMNEIIPDLKTMFPDLGAVAVESDPSVERGGIMAATREAEVDMRLATRLAAFEEAILGFSGKDAVAPWNTVQPGTFAPVDTSASAFSLSAGEADGETDEPEGAEPDRQPSPATGEEPVENDPPAAPPPDAEE